MRVVMVAACAFPAPQGSQLLVHHTARALARAGHEVVVATYGHGVGPPDPAYSLARLPRWPGWERVRAGPDVRKPALDVALGALVAGLGGDVVHAHHYEGLAAALIARARTGVPVVYDAHTLLADELPTYLDHGRGLARLAGRAADRLLPRRADAAVALSAAGEVALRGLGCTRVVRLPPGLDPDELCPRRGPVPGERPRLVYAGTPDRFQDLDVLLDAARMSPEVELVLVSSAPPEAWAGWRLGRARVEHARGWVETRARIAEASVAALPRARCPGFPMKLLNYLGMGVPTVVAEGSAQGLPGEVVVPGGDARAFAEGVRRALAGEARPDPGEVLRRHDWAARASGLCALYRTIARSE